MSENAHIGSSREADRLLGALEEQLTAGDEHFELVVIGGSALLALGLVSRVTQDVDVVALADGSELLEAVPLPAPLVEAATRVARDFGLPDQIHLKLHAAVDPGGPSKHLSDLEAIKPTSEELMIAARWSRTHDPSEGYLSVLVPALEYLGAKDADLSD